MNLLHVRVCTKHEPDSVMWKTSWTLTHFFSAGQRQSEHSWILVWSNVALTLWMMSAEWIYCRERDGGECVHQITSSATRCTEVPQYKMNELVVFQLVWIKHCENGIMRCVTFNPRRIWYMRNCTWSSVSFWHFTMLLRSAPIKWVTRYLPTTKRQSSWFRNHTNAGGKI